MSAQSYYNNNNNDNNSHNNSYQNYNQAPAGQRHDQRPPAYGQNTSYQSHQPSAYSQDGDEPLNWGYGSGGAQPQQPPPQNYRPYDSQRPGPYNTQQPQSYGSNQGYGQGYNQGQDFGRQQQQGYSQPYSAYQSQDQYPAGRHSPQPPTHDSNAPDYYRQSSPNPQYGGQYANQAAGSQAYPGAPGQTADDRGLLGALGGAAAGGYAGHKMGHGVIGTLGGAYAGHKLEDHMKDKKKKKKEDKHGHGGRRDSSSSSSSSDDDKKKKKKYGAGATAAAAAAGGGAMYAHHQQGQHRGDEPLLGNFSASSTQISLDRDYDLIASCGTINGTQKLSSINLNDCLNNSWGQLTWARGGGFGSTSRNVRLIEGGRVLEAELGDGRGSWNLSRIRLDERITNQNGDLQFLD